jgi:hypothetical protein
VRLALLGLRGTCACGWLMDGWMPLAMDRIIGVGQFTNGVATWASTFVWIA